MLKEEFEKLTGMQVDEATFQGIHEMYMMAGDNIGKEEFCQAYKIISSKTSTLRVMLGILVTAKEWDAAKNEAVELYTKAKKKQWEKQRELGLFLLEEAHRMSSGTARAKAIELLGCKDYIIECINRGYNLWSEDSKLLLDILKKDED